MAMGAGDVLVAAEDRVIEQLVPQRGLAKVELQKVRRLQRARQIASPGRQGEQEEEMRKKGFAAIGLTAVLLASPLSAASIEEGRDLMEAGKFQEAYDAFWPAARSGRRPTRP